MDNNKSKVLLSLLAGATAGVVAGLLLAPDSGKKSRATLLTSASKWGGDIDKVFRDGLGRLQEMTGRLGGMMGQGGSEGSQAGSSSGADDMFNDFSSENGGSGSGRKSGGASGSGSMSGGSSAAAGSGSDSTGASRSNPGTSPS